MNLGLDDRMRLIEGLDLSIELKEYEILGIEARTEEDYRAAFRLEKFFPNGLNVEDLKKRDIVKVEKEINKIRELRELINSGKNHVMLVSKDVKLEMIEKDPEDLRFGDVDFI